LAGEVSVVARRLKPAGQISLQCGAEISPAGDIHSPMHGARAATGSRPQGLTPRETEILSLVATGHTNREIADALVLSVRTVERHITNLYTKIGARNRADATMHALRVDGLKLKDYRRDDLARR
jgi:DNA-binding NarL/FixJ family response regulator